MLWRKRHKDRNHYAGFMRKRGVSSRFHMDLRYIDESEMEQGETSMSVIPLETTPRASRSGQKSIGFWRKLALALDEYFLDRARWAVPQVTLRRSRHDFERCRRLMHKV
jgi:hypothetical protein